MKTGDLILCSGNGKLSKRIINYQNILRKLDDDSTLTEEDCQISHVGMVVSNGVEVFESTTMNEWCGKKGVQINPFPEWLDNYNGNVWIRKMILPKTGKYAKIYNNPIYDEIQSNAESLIGKPYENGICGALELALAGIQWEWFVNKFKLAEKLKTKDAVFCSEVDAIVYQKVGILNKFVRANKMPPCQWFGNGSFDKNLINEFSFGEPILIKV